jgi:hypothetical protein
MINVRKGVVVEDGGAKQARLVWDNQNHRLNVLVGTTTVGYFDATNGFVPSVPFGSQGGLRLKVNDAVAAAGSVQGDATQLSEGFTRVTGANGTVGVKLPAAAKGMIVAIKGDTAGVLKVWPSAGDQINAVGADTAMSLASGKIPVILIAESDSQWFTFPLVPS